LLQAEQLAQKPRLLSAGWTRRKLIRGFNIKLDIHAALLAWT
jgi:hypothetical protein